MQTRLVCVRMSPALADALQALARGESSRRGERVTVGQLLREGARRTLKLAKRRAASTVQ
jgi:hypothetical protein